jgi:hypothetical protein
MSLIIGLDFETFYSKKLKYGIKQMIAEQYCKHPLFDPYMISVSDGTTCWSGSPKDFNWSVMEGATIISHNRYFDNTVYNEMVSRGWAPKIAYKEWHCSANLTTYLCNRRALAPALEYLYKRKISKDARDDANGKRWPQDFSPEKQKQMLEYARNDAFWCRKIWVDHSDKWPEKEKRLSNITIEQGMRGVQVNIELLNTYILQSHEMKISTEKLIPWMIDDGLDEEDDWTDFKTTPTSIKCIAEQCRRSKIPAPPVKSHFDDGEDRYEEWENLYKASNPWITSLSTWRSINKLYKSFLTVKARIRMDGTMPFGLKYFGAHTGRWSGDAKINMQNMRKKPILCTQIGLMEMEEKRVDAALKEKKNTGNWPAWVKYSIDFRNLFIPRPGKKMILSDLSQIEPRCLMWLAGDTNTLELVRGGMSVYEAHARTALGFTEEKLDKESTLYAEAKARVLALGYGAGWEKFIAMAALYTGMDLTEGDPEFETVIGPDGNPREVSGYGKRAREIVAAYRAQNPLIASKDKGIWARLDAMFKRSVGEDLKVVLPNGRVLRYEKVRCERRIKPDADGKPKQSIIFTADIGGKRFEIYGGKGTENLTQGMARDVFAEHLLTLHDTEGIDVLFTSHDEAIMEVDKHVTKEQVEEIMGRCPEWCPGLPVKAEAKIVPHYLK